jgi:hypothetical protein
MLEKIKMNQAGDPPAGGGGQPISGNNQPNTGDLLFGNPPANNAPPAGTPPASGAKPPITIPDNWKEALPEDIRALPFLEKFKDIGSLAKGYTNLEKMIGADKMPVPPQNATLEQLKTYFEKMGLPQDPKDYKLDFDAKLGIDNGFLDKFKAAAHGLNILPAQAKSLVEWFAKANMEAEKSQNDSYEAKRNEGISNLKKEWGAAFDNEVSKARAALKEFADKDAMEFFQKTDLGSNPHFLKMMAKMGATLAEDKIRGEGGQASGVYTPQQAVVKIAELKANVKGPYYDVNHPDHFAVKREVQDLYKIAYPGLVPRQEKSS